MVREIWGHELCLGVRFSSSTPVIAIEVNCFHSYASGSSTAVSTAPSSTTFDPGSRNEGKKATATLPNDRHCSSFQVSASTLPSLGSGLGLACAERCVFSFIQPFLSLTSVIFCSSSSSPSTAAHATSNLTTFTLARRTEVSLTSTLEAS